MSSTQGTPIDGRDARWRTISWQWRWPQPLEITGPVTSGLLLAMVAGYVPEGPATLGTTAAFALHAVATLITRCLRRTRE